MKVNREAEKIDPKRRRGCLERSGKGVGGKGPAAQGASGRKPDFNRIAVIMRADKISTIQAYACGMMVKEESARRSQAERSDPGKGTLGPALHAREETL